MPRWHKRVTYVATTRQVITGNGGRSIGTLIPAERLVGVKVRCPRCDASAATIWRRFDYLGREHPLYFTKCQHCHRRRPIEADEASFRLLEAGLVDPMAVLHDGIPLPADDGGDGHDGGERSPGESAVSVQSAKELAENRRRAYGRQHPLTFAARAELGDAVGRSGQAEEAAQLFEQLLVDQVKAAGPHSPAVLANRYRAAGWTARAGHRLEALAALRGLLADQEGILGDDHANTLITRATIAQLIDDTGGHDEALEMLRQVYKDQIRVLGSEHPATKATHRLLAEWEGT